MSFTIAILGRPNVGKSTLFNRLVGRKIALVDDTPGVTRDRREGEARLGDLEFRLIDTAGLEEGQQGTLEDRMRFQTEQAVRDADVALMMFDARAGITPLDHHFSTWIRRLRVPVVLVANKAESKAASHGLYDAYSLGLGEPIGLSAEHGEGLADLYQSIVDALTAAGRDPYEAEQADEQPEPSISEPFEEITEGDLDFEFQDDAGEEIDDRPLRMAVVGRPNAGKSTLINTLLGEDRLITGPEAGLTRDSIGVDWEWDGRPVKLFDTAGLRKRAKVTEKLEKLSAGDTIRAIRFAEVVLLLIDGERGFERQDLKIAEHVATEGRALIILINKWDAVDDRLARQREVSDTLTRSLPQLKGVTVLAVSALEGKGLGKIMPAVEEVMGLWNARISTAGFNRWLADVTEKHPPPSVQGRRIKIRYGAQIKTRPPTFLLFCNRPDDLPDSYSRYLENEMRRDFSLPAIPLRILVKKGENPYAKRRRAKDRKR